MDLESVRHLTDDDDSLTSNDNAKTKTVSLTLSLSSSSSLRRLLDDDDETVSIDISFPVDELARALAAHLREQAPDGAAMTSPPPVIAHRFSLRTFFEQPFIDTMIARWQQYVDSSITQAWLESAMSNAGVPGHMLTAPHINDILKTSFRRAAEKIKLGGVRLPAPYARRVIVDVVSELSSVAS